VAGSKLRSKVRSSMALISLRPPPPPGEPAAAAPACVRGKKGVFGCLRRVLGCLIRYPHTRGRESCAREVGLDTGLHVFQSTLCCSNASWNACSTRATLPLNTCSTAPAATAGEATSPMRLIAIIPICACPSGLSVEPLSLSPLSLSTVVDRSDIKVPGCTC
jgi:hypothetical protein